MRFFTKLQVKTYIFEMEGRKLIDSRNPEKEQEDLIKGYRQRGDFDSCVE